jgi:hypothetical protein
MSLNRPLIHRLIRCDTINQWGKLFVVIGRRTFSAAMNLAVDLERHTRALFVGEPTGGAPQPLRRERRHRPAAQRPSLHRSGTLVAILRSAR